MDMVIEHVASGALPTRRTRRRSLYQPPRSKGARVGGARPWAGVLSAADSRRARAARDSADLRRRARDLQVTSRPPPVSRLLESARARTGGRWITGRCG